ncbi:MAG: DNA polymerase I [Candidatus Cloacimonetes bacterium]|nr:DNA polymerase I [Candidatus Cloacimonadota bacterium]
MKETLYLIDGTALAYRSYYAFINNPLINSKGTPVSALNGVINSFLKIIDQFKPTQIAISFDRKEPTFRHQLTEQYKIHRPPMPDDLIIQIEMIKEFFELIGMKEISMAGYEADDILGTLAVQNQDQYNVIIITGDKDYAQLVNDSIMIYDPKNEKIYNKASIIEKYEILPEQFIDYLALVGDSADNIPGAKGIGPKTATPLLQEFKNIDNLYINIDKISSKSTKEKLLSSKENVYLSQKLATIITDAPIDLNSFNYQFNIEQLTPATDYLIAHELKYMADRISKLLPKIASSDNGVLQDDHIEKQRNSNSFNAILLDTEDALAAVLEKIKDAKAIALDTETDSVESLFANLVGISFCFDEENAYYIPVAHLFAQNLDTEIAVSMLKEAFSDKLIIGHNFKFDYEVFYNHGWDICNPIFDTMLAAYILDPGRSRLSLDSCALNEFDYEMIPIDQLIGKGKKQLTFDTVEVNQACRYSAEDSWISYRLYKRFNDELLNKKLDKLYYDIEIPLIKVLADMERNGVFINVPLLNELSAKTGNQLLDLQKEIYQIAGEEFNINSTQQLSHILFENMQIKAVKKTKTGYSTDNDVLEKLAEEHLIAQKLIEYRQLSKLLNTYIDAFPKLIKNKTGRIHSSFNQTVTSTGRLSSSNPNMQNIPVRTELGREMRRAIIPQNNDYVIVAADYSQIELRLMALIAEDENMLSAFQNNEDIHSRTAAIIFHKDLKDITSDERRKAKIINFGIIYGMGPQSLSKELGISMNEAKDFIKDYYDKFPKIISFIEKQKEFARRESYVETLFGRQLPLPNIHSSNQMIKSEAERIAVNMPIQGTAADVIKIAMIRLHELFKDNPKVKMIIQVHDELVFEIHKEIVEETVKIIQKIMENSLEEQFNQKVRLLVEAGVGKNWAEAH